MQTKKRAKSVSFGKPKSKAEEPKVEEAEKKEIKEETEVIEEEKVEHEEIEPRTEAEGKEKTEEKREEEPMEVHLGNEVSEAETAELAKKEEFKEEVKEPEFQEELPPETPPFRDFSRQPEREAKRSNIWFFIWVVLITFILALACITGVYYFTTNSSIKPPSLNFNFSSPTATPVPTAVPTPTPKPVDLTAYTINVLNGSNVTGEAGRLKTKLVNAGFKVGTTGNADNNSYTNTVIEAKKDTNQEYLSALIAELKKTYLIDANITTLRTSNTSDVIVIIGSSTAK